MHTWLELGSNKKGFYIHTAILTVSNNCFPHVPLLICIATPVTGASSQSRSLHLPSWNLSLALWSLSLASRSLSLPKMLPSAAPGHANSNSAPLCLQNGPIKPLRNRISPYLVDKKYEHGKGKQNRKGKTGTIPCLSLPVTSSLRDPGASLCLSKPPVA